MKGINYFYAINTETINDSTLVTMEDYRKYDEKMLYEAIKGDSTLLSLGTPEDSAYQYFYDSVKYSSIGKYDEVKDSIISGNTEEAKALNDAVENNDAMDNNRNLVNKIYLNTFAEGIFYFDSIQEAQLTALAYLDPGVDGDAVYSARAMLRIEPDVIETRAMQSDGNELSSSEPKESLFNLYPNPNDGTMHLSYKLNKQQVGLVVIYSILGEVINTYTLTQNEGIITINEPTLKSGLYFYQVLIDNHRIGSGKIIISK
jgi:Secretion system C-terminal sorting domain